jgi:hypothetical protein
VSKNLTANISTQLAAAQKRPSHLYSIELTYATLRFAACKTDMVFPTGGANTFQAKTVKHETPIAAINHSGVGRARLWIADGEGDMVGYHQADNFKGKKITVTRIYRDAMSNALDRVEVIEGYINRVSWDYQWFIIEVTSGDTLRQKLPKRGYTVRCPYKPGCDECNADGCFPIDASPFYRTGEMTGSADSFTDVNRVEAEDYWKYAQVILKNGSNVYRRTVTAFASSVFTLDSPTPIAASTEVTYELWRGCDGTWDACSGNQAYGPNADNTNNYGGFLHIKSSEQG